ncbi:MAG: hypothetical protein IJS38_02585 [Erysipelotrichaceae bacterium]|nr:hypothetical protein [Erysipelotrichaceae bacterium]
MKKIVIIADDEKNIQQFSTGYVGNRYKQIEEKYDCKIAFVIDASLASNDNPDLRPKRRIEIEGPEWAVHDEKTLEAVKDANIVLVGFHAGNKQLLNAAEKLEMLGVLRSGWENVNLPAYTERGVKVCVCPGRNSEPVSDYAVTLMLALNRNVARDNVAHRTGWKYATYAPDRPDYRPLLISDATIGFVGFGIIAKKVVNKLSGLKPKRLVAYDPYANKEEAARMGVELIPLNEVMKQSDIISIHARLLPETQGLVGAEQISLMKPTALFINTARGALVDEEALTKALQEDKIRGAALDVFSVEPLPEDHPLRKLPNVIITPHIAGAAGDTFRIVNDIMCDELERYLSNSELKNQINK